MKLIKSILVAMLLGIMAIEVAWAYEDNVNWYLVNSANRGDLKAVKYYIRKGADVNTVKQYNYDGATTPLMEAVRKGHKEIAEYLIYKGADIDAIFDSHRNTTLHLAVKAGNKEMVEYLISKGANMEIRNMFDDTALYTALSTHQQININERIEIVKLLIDKGADVNAMDRHKQTTPLLIVTTSCDLLGLVKYLVDNGADVNAMDRHKRTPLLYAIKSCSGKSNLLESVKSLVEKGADVNAKDIHGQTALMYVAGGDDSELVKYLVSKGADVNAIDNQGKSVFDRVDKLNRNDEIFEFLLSSGAKCDDCDE